jgi:hypothetical protein
MVSKIIIFSSLVAVLALAFFIASPAGESGESVVMFKSPTCGCCVNYAAYLERQGFSVETVMTQDMSVIKADNDIPRNMESCHTVMIGDYFVEGHIPIEAVNQMLEEKPSIDGIALPGMPSGSPGMPGIKNTKFTIYGLANGEYSQYTVI